MGQSPAGPGGEPTIPVYQPVFLGSLAFVLINFLLPVYTRQLGADAVTIGGMYTAFVVSLLVFRPLVGMALDRVGRRWFFTGAFLFYALAMWQFSRAGSIGDFFIARALQGVGASLMWVSARTIIVDLTWAGGRGAAMGRLTSRSVQGSMIGAVFGFTLLGMFPIEVAWRLSFAGYAVAALFVLVLSITRVRESGTRVSAQSKRPAREPLSADLVKLFVIVALSGFAAALIEPIYLIFLQDRFELSVQALAFAFFPAGIVFAILPNYTGKMVDRYGGPRLLALGFLSAALVSMALPWLPGILWVAVAYTLSAAGRTLSMPAEDAMVGDAAPESDRGRVMGLKETAAAFGAALGPPAGGWVYEIAAPELAFMMNGALLLVAVMLVALWFAGSTYPGKSEKNV
ncbi:MAG: MFS transporter [Gammaproteobacteria bacterium]|nr:MAG: MFS transporter [Gammaproteobacteria bacterium]